jgi:hypothetical protein
MNPPLELSAVQRDDALLDQVGQRQHVADGTDLVAALLVGWVTDICDEGGSPPVEVSLPTATSTRRRSGRPVIVGLVATAVLVSASSVAVAATRATPGSVLWPVTRVVAARHAQSVLARERVLRSLAVAQRQAAQGNAAAAAANLDDARSRVGDVQPVDGKSSLQAKVAALQAALDHSGAGTTNPTGPGTASVPPPDPQPSPTSSPTASPDAASPAPDAAP